MAGSQRRLRFCGLGELPHWLPEYPFERSTIADHAIQPGWRPAGSANDVFQPSYSKRKSGQVVKTKLLEKLTFSHDAKATVALGASSASVSFVI